MARSEDTTPLFVRIPTAAARQLEAAASARGASKRQVVTDLIGQGLLGGASTVQYGHASVISTPDSEILTLDEAAALLRVGTDDLRALAESGQLPARRIGDEWRIARTALLGWLGGGAADAQHHSPSRRRGAVGFAGETAAPAATNDETSPS